MSQKFSRNSRSQNRREKSTQERILQKVRQNSRSQEQSDCVCGYEEDRKSQNPAFQGLPSRQNEETNNFRNSESYEDVGDVICYDDDKPVTVDPEYFHESYGQVNNNASQPPEKYKSTGQRSRSVPPSSNSKLGARFPYESNAQNVYESNNYRPVENEVLNEPMDTIAVEQANRNSGYFEVEPCPLSRTPSKKVSYAQSRNDRAPVGLSNQSSPIQCRFRAEFMETDDSDISFTVANPIPRKGGRSRSNKNYQQQQQPLPSRTASERAFNYEGPSLEDFVNRNANRASNNRFSQDSIQGPGTGSSGSFYGNDVLPLPIEIPDNVADAEAFLRYLSVRRGAITPVRQQNMSFEKRNQSNPSYESIGRRPRKSMLGITGSGQIGPEASRRTTSLSHAIMTIALLSASICQLRFLISYSHAHAYPILNYFLVFTSIILEVAAGIGYVLIARCSYDEAQTEAIHNYLIFALFIVAVSNVILAAFAFDVHICDEVQRQSSHNSAPTTATQDQQFNQPMSRSDKVMDLRYMPLE